MMTIFFREFSEYSKRFKVVTVMDGASWHKAKALDSFENLSIIHQPPYSSEVNPVEHPWERLREKYFRNGFISSMDELENNLSNALLEVIKDTKTIRKLTGFHWAVI